MKEKSIKSTGQLREFLAGLLNEVKEGAVEVDKAVAITKIATQINESFYAEAKVTTLRREMGDSYVKLGKVDLGDFDK